MPPLSINYSRYIFPGVLILGALACAVAVFVGGPLGALGLVALAGLLVSCFTHPLVPFTLYFGALFFADTQIPGLPISLNQILAPLFFLSVVVYIIRGKALSMKFGLLPLLAITTLYFAVNGLLGQDFENGILYARYVVIYLILALGLAMTLSSERTILALAWIIVLLTTGAAIDGIFEAVEKDIIGNFTGSWGYKYRVSGTAPNPIVYAWNMVYAFPFAFLLYSELQSRYTRLLAFVLGMLILGAAVLTFNRQTYIVIGLILALSAVLYTYKNKAALLGLMTILAVPAAFTILPVVLKRLFTITNIGKDYSFLERRDSYLIGMEMFRDSPVFGIGFGSYSKVWHDYIPPEYTTYFAQYRPGAWEKFMDMGMMAVLVETGLIGLTLFLGIILYILVRSWTYRRDAVAAGDSFAQNLASTTILVLAIIVATSFIQDTFLYPRVWIFYGVCMLIDPRQLPLRQTSSKTAEPIDQPGAGPAAGELPDPV